MVESLKWDISDESQASARTNIFSLISMYSCIENYHGCSAKFPLCYEGFLSNNLH